MKRQDYFPSRLGDQPEWLENFATKIPGYAPALGLVAGTVTAGVADARWCAFVIGIWRTQAQEFGRTISGAVEEALSGTGTSAQVLPTYTAATLPAGVVAVNPGALERLFRFVRDIKNSPTFTDPIGHDLGVLGSEAPAPPPGGGNPPRIKLFVEQGITNEIVRMTFFKDGHQGLYIESRRGTGDWEFLAIDTDSPYLDQRSLLVAGQPEVRDYRARFWDRGEPNGDWCDIAKIAVGP